jgi:hypothetical protein
MTRVGVHGCRSMFTVLTTFPPELTCTDYSHRTRPRFASQDGSAGVSFRAGELDAFEFDQIAFQYSRAAKELWKFCNLTDVVFTAGVIGERPPADWWERGAPKR